MKTLDLRSSLFWLAISIAVVAQSLRMGIGTVQNPGMGFMSFWAGGLLAILAIGLFIKTILNRRRRGSQAALAGGWRKTVLSVLSALVVYAIIMPVAGYLTSTFLLMTFLYWFADPTGMRWFFWCLVLSLATTVISYYVFSVLLNCQFPPGVLGI
jgi:putative tricarboxylic transport membrane protein